MSSQAGKSSTDANGPSPDVLYVDTHIVAVNKPAGMPVQPDRTGDRSLLDVVREAHPDAHLVHRIDRPVSGVVLFARGADAAAGFGRLFREGLVQKTYWAIVHGRVEGGGQWAHRISEDPRSRKAWVDEADGVEARTQFRSLAIGDRYSLIELRPEQGRFHQLRVQCAAGGHPIKGDVKYGARRGERDRSIALHARELSFTHPFTGREMRISAPTPGASPWDRLLAASVPVER